MELSENGNYILEIKQILTQARQNAYRAVNTSMVQAYWLTGRRIVVEEQNGKERAEYGKEIIKKLSRELTDDFGKGFSERTIREFRQFYNLFSELFIIEQSDQAEANIQRTPFAISINPIWRTPFANLYWSHYQRILRVSEEVERQNYLPEAELITEIEREKLIIQQRFENGK
jgi:hypothetical protein